MFERDVPLAPLTTLGLGGSADHFVAAEDEAQLLDALRWAQDKSLAVTILGGGSNAVVSDQGVRGLVIQLAMRGIRRRGVDVEAVAGENWAAFV
ncbi:MAG: UDP-N-acetylmuramate dehydrogenase, partial [Polyangiales bacterium]